MKDFNKVIEVGAGDYYHTWSKSIIDKGVDTILFEPNVVFYNDLVEKFKGYKTVTIYNKAVSKQMGLEQFYNFGVAGWLKGNKCFANTHLNLDGIGDNYELYLDKLSTIIDTISSKDLSDLVTDETFLSINCNGAEQYILESLTKRPVYIRICLYCHNRLQWDLANPLINWFITNKYILAYNETNTHNTFFNLIYQRT